MSQGQPCRRIHRAVGGARLGVSDVEKASVDLLERRKRCVRPRLDRGHLRHDLAYLREGGTDQTEFGTGESQRGGAQKTAATTVDAAGLVDSVHLPAPLYSLVGAMRLGDDFAISLTAIYPELPGNPVRFCETLLAIASGRELAARGFSSRRSKKTRPTMAQEQPFT
jgi:hypothetical protein